MNKKNNFKKITLIVLICAAVTFLAAFFIGLAYVSVNASAVSASDVSIEKDFEVQSGMTAKTVGAKLKSEGLIKNSRLFYVFARFPKFASFVMRKPSGIFKVQTGYYRLNSAMNLAEVFEEVSSGKVKYETVSIAEGLTLRKIAKIIASSGIVTEKDFVDTALNDGKKIFAELKLDIDSDSVEGFLYPDTYNIPVNYNSHQIIVMMISNMLKQITSHESTQGFTSASPDEFYKMITLASIVEREYRAEDEAPLIAGVFKNRLEINMPLQSCATVEYIITELRGRPHPKIIYYEDLEMKEPYNTYIYPGLPPGPISNPGFTAINAAINPQSSNYLYFTLTDSQAGRHTFSHDFNSHAKATAEFKTKKAAGN